MSDEEEFTLRREASSESAERIWYLADAANNLHDLPEAQHLYAKVLQMIEAEFQPAVELSIEPTESSS